MKEENYIQLGQSTHISLISKTERRDSLPANLRDTIHLETPVSQNSTLFFFVLALLLYVYETMFSTNDLICAGIALKIVILIIQE